MAETRKNYLALENNAQCTYLHKENRDVSSLVLSSDDRRIWLSSSSRSFPHVLLFDISNLHQRPQSDTQKPGYYRCLAINCWHAYTSNPSLIKLLVSLDGMNFVFWQNIQLELKAGVQIVKLREKIRASDINYFKLEILKTHGQSEKTYLNQVFLYEEIPMTYYNANILNATPIIQKGNESAFFSAAASKPLRSAGDHLSSINTQAFNQSYLNIYNDDYIRPESQITLESCPTQEKQTIQSGSEEE